MQTWFCGICSESQEHIHPAWRNLKYLGLVSKSCTWSSWETLKILDAGSGIYIFHRNHTTFLYFSFHCSYARSLALLSSWQTWNLNAKPGGQLEGVRALDCSKILWNKENCKVKRHCTLTGLSLQKVCKWPCLQVHCNILCDFPAAVHPHRNIYPPMHARMNAMPHSLSLAQKMKLFKIILLE